MKKIVYLVVLAGLSHTIDASLMAWFKNKFSNTSSAKTVDDKDDATGGILIVPVDKSARRDSFGTASGTASVTESGGTSVTSHPLSDISGSSARSVPSARVKLSKEIDLLKKEPDSFKRKDLFETKFFNQVAQGVNFDQIQMVMNNPNFDMRRALEHAIINNNEKAMRYIIASSNFTDFNEKNIVSVGALVESVIPTAPYHVLQYVFEVVKISDKAFVRCLLKALQVNRLGVYGFLCKLPQFAALKITLDPVLEKCVDLYLNNASDGYAGCMNMILDHKSQYVTTECLVNQLQKMLQKPAVVICHKCIALLSDRDVSNDAIQKMLDVALQRSHKVAEALVPLALRHYLFAYQGGRYTFAAALQQKFIDKVLQENVDQSNTSIVWLILQGLKKNTSKLSFNSKQIFEQALLSAVQNNNIDVAMMLLHGGFYSDNATFLQQAYHVVKAKNMPKLQQELYTYIKAYTALSEHAKDDMYKDAFADFISGNSGLLYSLLFITGDTQKINANFKEDCLPYLRKVIAE